MSEAGTKKERIAALERSFRTDCTANSKALKQLTALTEEALGEEGADEVVFLGARALQRCWITAVGSSVLFGAALLPADGRTAVLSALEETKRAEQLEAALAFCGWAAQQYSAMFKVVLAGMARHSEAGLQLPAVKIAHAMLRMEGRKKRELGLQSVEFKSGWYAALLEALLLKREQREVHQQVLDALEECFLSYDDALYFTMRAIKPLVSKAQRGEWQKAEEQRLSSTLFSVLERVISARERSMLEGEAGAQPLLLMCSGDAKSKAMKALRPKEEKRAFSDAMMAFFRLPMENEVYKRVLQLLDAHILPHLRHPKMMLDFLLAAHDSGGVVAMLSLKSLFHLITAHNLELPEYYTRIYRMLSPDSFHVKYRADFFLLLELSLRSTYLPEYLMAAFLKKLCRLALTAPPHGALVCLAISFNLVKRNQNLMDLLQSEWGTRQPVQLHLPDAPAPVEEETSTAKRRWRRAAPVDRRKKNEAKVSVEEAQELTSALEAVIAQDDGAGQHEAEDDGSKQQEEDEDYAGEGAGKKRKKERKKKKKKKKKKEKKEKRAASSDDEEAGKKGAKRRKKSEEDEKEAGGEVNNNNSDEANDSSNEEQQATNDSDGEEEEAHDPFLDDSADPKECRALDSQLWELLALEKHYLSDVSKMAGLFRSDMEKPFFDIEEYAALSTQDMLVKAKRRRVGRVPLEHRKRDIMLLPQLGWNV